MLDLYRLLDSELETYRGLSFSRFAWILARALRVLGKAFAQAIVEIVEITISVQILVDRVNHLNEVFGYFIPSLTYALSLETVAGNKVAFRPFTDDADKLSETYEPMVRKLLSPQSSDIAVDIGANIGVHTIWLSKKVGPFGLVIAIEPEQNNFRLLTLNQRLNQITNIVPIRVALSSRRAKGELTVPRHSLMGQATISVPAFSSRSYSAVTDLETLDNIISDRKVPKVSLIKIDVEGSELAVLQGAKRTIEKFHPRLVIEVHGASNREPIRQLLESMNMKTVSETIASSRPNEDRHFVLAISNKNG